jgi:hypothetical protein
VVIFLNLLKGSPNFWNIILYIPSYSYSYIFIPHRFPK